MAKREDKWEFYQDAKGEWRWRRIAPNGEIVGASPRGTRIRPIVKRTHDATGGPAETFTQWHKDLRLALRTATFQERHPDRRFRDFAVTRTEPIRESA